MLEISFNDQQIFMDDKIYCIRKDNLHLEIIGKVVQKEKQKVAVKITSVKTQYIDISDYYVFVKRKQSKRNL